MNRRLNDNCMSGRPIFQETVQQQKRIKSINFHLQLRTILHGRHGGQNKLTPWFAA